jgi:small GTP-binding protein
VIVGTAGHVDHGKTALVRALTGVDGDRLKEEKARGITIDLGFAYLPLPDGKTLGFVDVPGHERFVHTMVAGAAGIDIALLVVAADDGVMPQTLEHLAILDLLGTRRALIALTKIDLATPERLAEVHAQIREAVKATALADAEILPVSSTTDQGIDALRERLVAEARALDERSDEGRFRLAIDRVFTLAGIGVVVTGTVLSGVVRVRDALLISPPGLPARVRSLHAQNQPVEIGRAGDRCALNLTGEGITKDAIHRGDVLVDPFLRPPIASTPGCICCHRSPGRSSHGSRFGYTTAPRKWALGSFRSKASNCARATQRTCNWYWTVLSPPRCWIASCCAMSPPGARWVAGSSSICAHRSVIAERQHERPNAPRCASTIRGGASRPCSTHPHRRAISMPSHATGRCRRLRLRRSSIRSRPSSSMPTKNASRSVTQHGNASLPPCSSASKASTRLTPTCRAWHGKSSARPSNRSYPHPLLPWPCSTSTLQVASFATVPSFASPAM